MLQKTFKEKLMVKNIWLTFLSVEVLHDFLLIALVDIIDICVSFRFRCEDPVIKVKISNLISFVCPVYDLRPYLENYLYTNGEIYESLYFVDDNFTAYNTCDATSKILRCSTNWNVHKTLPEIEKQIFL